MKTKQYGSGKLQHMSKGLYIFTVVLCEFIPFFWVIAALMWPYHVTKEQKGRIIIDSAIGRQICWSWRWDAYKFEENNIS